MRFVLFLGISWAVMLTIVFGDPAFARSETRLARPQCAKLALEKKKLEKTGVETYLAMKPREVLSSHGRSVIERVRHYIGVREKVLFRCPRNVLNATAAPIEKRLQAKPPLPVKGPKRAVRARPQLRPTVPLPVKRKSSLKFPRSQG